MAHGTKKHVVNVLEAKAIMRKKGTVCDGSLLLKKMIPIVQGTKAYRAMHELRFLGIFFKKQHKTYQVSQNEGFSFAKPDHDHIPHWHKKCGQDLKRRKERLTPNSFKLLFTALGRRSQVFQRSSK